MSRRTAAGLLALGLIAALVLVGATRPVKFVTFRPGPTMNVLGEFAGKEIIQIKGHPSYPDDGELRMVTVYQSSPDRRLNLVEVLSTRDYMLVTAFINSIILTVASVTLLVVFGAMAGFVLQRRPSAIRDAPRRAAPATPRAQRCDKAQSAPPESLQSRWRAPHRRPD